MGLVAMPTSLFRRCLTGDKHHHQQPDKTDNVRARSVISPPGIAMSPAGLCYTDVTFFFKYRPSHSRTGGRIATRIVALIPSMKKLQRLQVW